VSAEATRDRLRDAALATVLELGIAGVSARTVASRAGCNQASIYYHFGSLHGLLTDASLRATEQRVATYRDRLAEVTSVTELVDVARELHAEEHRLGNVTVLAQMLAGARTDPELRGPTAAALRRWIVEVEATLRRLLDGSVLAEVVDVPSLARAISAAFVGIELVDGVEGDDDAIPTLDGIAQLAAVVQVVLDLGPVASASLRRRVARANGELARRGDADAGPVS
jgi:AcrR family transcriptional regulator